MGLGNYYITRPETFAKLNFPPNGSLHSGISAGIEPVNLALDIQKKRPGYGSVDFGPQNTKLLPVSLPTHRT